MISVSYSRLDTFETCPQKFYRLYVAKDVKDEGSAATARGSAIHKQLELAISEGIGLPNTLMYLDPLINVVRSYGYHNTEEQVAVTETWQPCDYYGPDVWMRSIFDVIAHENGDTGLLIDWKTGKRRLKIFQLEIFAAMAFARYPHLDEIDTFLIWVDQHGSDKFTFTKGDVPEIQAKIESKCDDIDHAEHSGNWRAKPGFHCNWCPARKTCSEAQ